MERTQTAKKERGLQVIRAVVTEQSSLVGQTPAQVDFKRQYKTKIVTIQKKGHNTTEHINNLVIDAGDMLVL
jgi:Trk K+ transport system NAD-binding subunit